MPDEAATQELKSRPASLAVAVVSIIFSISAALAILAHELQSSGRSFQAAELLGAAILCIGVGLNPVNWLWVLIPFIRNQRAVSGRIAVLGCAVMGVGWVVFLIGMIGRYWRP